MRDLADTSSRCDAAKMLARAVEFELITQDRVNNLTEAQRALFSYVNLMTLFGITLHTPTYANPGYKGFTPGQPFYTKTTKPLIDAETLLGLSEEEAESLNQHNIFKLVEKERLTIEQARDLTSAQRIRLCAGMTDDERREYRERKGRGEDPGIYHQPYDNLFKEDRLSSPKADALLAMLNNMPDDYWPDRISLSYALVELEPEAVSEIAEFRPEQIDALLNFTNKGSSGEILKLNLLTQTPSSQKNPYGTSPGIISWADLKMMSPEDITKTAVLAPLLIKETITPDMVPTISLEQAYRLELVEYELAPRGSLTINMVLNATDEQARFLGGAAKTIEAGIYTPEELLELSPEKLEIVSMAANALAKKVIGRNEVGQLTREEAYVAGIIGQLAIDADLHAQMSGQNKGPCQTRDDILAALSVYTGGKIDQNSIHDFSPFEADVINTLRKGMFPDGQDKMDFDSVMSIMPLIEQACEPGAKERIPNQPSDDPSGLKTAFSPSSLVDFVTRKIGPQRPIEAYPRPRYYYNG